MIRIHEGLIDHVFILRSLELLWYTERTVLDAMD